MKTHTLDSIIEKLNGWLAAIIEMLPNFLLAVLILVGFYFLAKLARKIFTKVLSRTYTNIELTRLLSRVVFIAVILTGAMFALSVLKLEKTVTSILAGAGIVGLALGFAFQDMAANFVSGFAMAAKRPFEIGDVIEVEGYIGTVLSINLRSTEIMSFDGNEIIIPNRILFENPLTNYYRTKTRRIDLSVGVSYGDDLELVEKITKEAIQSLSNLNKSNEVHVLFKEFGDSSINLEVQYWVPYDTYFQYLQGISDGVKAVKKAYDANGITIPFPIRTLDFGIKGGKDLSEMTVQMKQEQK
jgi:small conductance mechanosensitive channel